MVRFAKNALIVAAAAAITSTASAALEVSITPSSTLNGFINVSELPANGGAYVYGQSFPTAQTTAVFDGNTLNLGPMTINDSASFWFQGSGTNPGGPGVAGNKNIDSSSYVEDDTIAGQTIHFTGQVTGYTLVSPYTVTAFIKDFTPTYSSNTPISMPL